MIRHETANVNISSTVEEEVKQLQERLPLHQTHSEDAAERVHPSKELPRKLLLMLRTSILLLANIAAWYATNGFNGIAMQSFAAGIKQNTTDERLWSTIAISCMVTALQLLFGAVLGYTMLYARNICLKQQFSGSFSIRNLFSWEHVYTSESCLALLHGIGSLCTNIGFMYGSASLVQIIKLLEPFETLVMTKLLIPTESKLFHSGVISSMTLTVGAAISLIKSQKTHPHPHAILFALLSGMTLSSRNVLQRRLLSSEQSHHDHHQKSELEKSLVSFAELSLQSSIVLSVAAVSLNAFAYYTSQHYRDQLTTVLASSGLNWRVFTWHPLYNAFSMITLGFCTALTHSLLNAGKRVFAIAMAIVWFRESFTRSTLAGLCMVMLGGCWYTMESSQTGTAAKKSSASVWLKPIVCLALLDLIHYVHMLESKSV